MGDDLDGCDVDFGEDPTSDDEVPYLALFEGADTPEEIALLKAEYEKLAEG